MDENAYWRAVAPRCMYVKSPAVSSENTSIKLPQILIYRFLYLLQKLIAYIQLCFNHCIISQ